MRRGKKSAAQTPAPKSDKIYGSKKNIKGSAKSSSSAKSIILSDEIINVLKDKQKEYNSNHNNKVTLATLKAVFRRGAGAYSKSHRPTITGGAPNSRTAWSYARVNKFLEKKAGKKVKKAYIQDDDLMEKGGEVNQDIVCVNCGWEWNTSDSDDSDKYVCHKCMFDNTLYYIKFSKNEQNDDIMSKLKQPKSLQEISKLHNVSVEILEKQLIKGIKAEKEHTTDDLIAETIALHHIEEIADYYDRLEKMEKSAQPIALPDSYSKYESLKKVLNNQGYDINEIEYNQSIENEFKEGGVVVGKRHSESDENGTGEKFLVESTGQIVELEGGEAVLSKESMQSDDKFSFQGKKMTGREIASILNHKYGGVEFEKGGSVDSVCGCKTKYYHGGELPTAIVDSLKGGEAVITVKTMESKDKYNFNNRSLTPRQILSIINEKSGGKKFEEGGILKSNQFNNTKDLTKMVYFTQKVLY
jgi:hypothetical protein